MKKLLLIIFVCSLTSLCSAGIDCKGDAGNDDMIVYSSDLGISAYPFTFCVRWDITAGTQNIVASLHDSSAADVYYYLEVANDHATIVARNTTLRANEGTTDIGSGIHSVCAVWAAADDRKVYVNGGANEAQGAVVSVTFNTATDQFSVCGSDDSTPTSNAQKLYDISVWDVALTEAEAAQYHNGNLRRIALQTQSANDIVSSPLDDYTDGTTGMGGNSFRDESGSGNTGTLVDSDGDSIALAETEMSYQ